ncbi:HNH endonuclease signature motif containing protein [Mycobacterium sp. CnD-18-1]|uniref:HNH endonuclease signature motif containing protein n=1 Tax=Mycobacterium sp. CnD-18-1 TaxID=2917744 RepID=UPI0035AFBC76
MALKDWLVEQASRPDAKEPGECWEWHRAKATGGYGHVDAAATYGTNLTHRVAYIVAYGPLERGLTVDHICRNRLCYRPSHLRAMTLRENIMAEGSTVPSRLNALKTHCPRGHELSKGNLVLSHLKDGRRDCLICNRAQSTAWRLARKAESS